MISELDETQSLEDKMKFNLKNKRIEKRMTMKQVSGKLYISESFYCLIENGKRNPSVATAKKIARVLGFDWTEFFKETA